MSDIMTMLSYSWPSLLVLLVFGYFLGSVPFGLVLVRAAGLGDVRAIGSGNVGATNVLRTGRKGLALATLLLDSGKGAIAAALAWLAFGAVEAGLVAGAGAVIGHNFPIWLRFRGGKGVATTLGVLLVTCWPVGLLALLTWAIVAAIFRYSSLSALVALGFAPIFAFFFGTPIHVVIYFVLFVLALVMHRANISRLLSGTESKIGAKKDHRTA